jgi:hypothetical protein
VRLCLRTAAINSPWWWWYRLGITPDSSTRSLWQSYQQGHLGKVGQWTKEWEFCISVSEIPQGTFTCRKTLHGTYGFTSHPKEGVLRIFIAIKNSIFSAGSEPATLVSSGKHTNHYITEATPMCIRKQSRYMPWSAWGERRYSSYSFTTSALNGGEWSASRPGRALPTGKGPPVPIVQEAWWAPEPVWTQGLE